MQSVYTLANLFLVNLQASVNAFNSASCADHGLSQLRKASSLLCETLCHTQMCPPSDPLVGFPISQIIFVCPSYGLGVGG